MEHILIKPTLSCTANCPTCAGRRTLHQKLRARKRLSFERWQQVLSEAHGLGTWHLTISGGEPTLYQKLPELIATGRKLGWLVRMNSNGSLINREYAEQLVKAGLNIADISLYSPIPALHDAMRGTNGLWQKAASAVKVFSELRSRYEGFDVITQTILCRTNFTHFPELLRLHYQLGSSGMLVSYLEGDFARRYLFEPDEIQYFREKIIPKAVSACMEFDAHISDVAASRIRRIFSEDILHTEQWASGLYRPNRRGCRIPEKQALILPNGDVHPCNIVEYTHEPVMGNLFDRSLAEIWQGREWRDFRVRLHEKCAMCPMHHHLYIPLRSGSKWMSIAKLCIEKLRLQEVEKMAYRFLRSRLRGKN